jgi:type IV secretory pathway VirB2 component (pilin)
MNKRLWIVAALVIVACVLMHAQPAYATAGGGGGLPYESALMKVQQSATGPVAFVLSILGIVGAGGALIFGGDLSGFFRTMVILVLVIGLLISSVNVMQNLFGQGATIAAVDRERCSEERQGGKGWADRFVENGAGDPSVAGIQSCREAVSERARPQGTTEQYSRIAQGGTEDESRSQAASRQLAALGGTEDAGRSQAACRQLAALGGTEDAGHSQAAWRQL